MKYFMLNKNSKLTDAPWLINWYTTIRPKYINLENASLLLFRSLIYVEKNRDLVFPDIITSPFLLISPQLKKIVEIYQPEIEYKQIVLLEPFHDYVQLYFLPILPRISCLLHTSVLNADRSIIHRAVLDLSCVGDHSVFHIADIKNTYTILRLDLLESALIRGCIGLEYQEVAWEEVPNHKKPG